MKKILIPVIVDDRERHCDIPDLLRNSGQFTVTVARLKTGDYRVDDRYLIERKTLLDFATSMISGSLFRQASRLKAHGYSNSIYPALILEGTAEDLHHTGTSREALQGALITVMFFMGLPVLRSRSPTETVQIFRYITAQGRANVTGALHRSGYRPKGKSALQNYLLQGFPGIGPARAKSLLHRFGSIRAVMHAGEDELAAVPGIGADTARRINWLLEEKRESYRIH